MAAGLRCPRGAKPRTEADFANFRRCVAICLAAESPAKALRKARLADPWFRKMYPRRRDLERVLDSLRQGKLEVLRIDVAVYRAAKLVPPGTRANLRVNDVLLELAKLVPRQQARGKPPFTIGQHDLLQTNYTKPHRSTVYRTYGNRIQRKLIAAAQPCRMTLPELVVPQ